MTGPVGPPSPNAPGPSGQLHLPAGMRYDCVQCGRGCRDEWEIRVDAKSEERLAPLGIAAHQVRDPGAEPFRDSAIEPGARVLSRCGDACVFLRDDMKCSLHAALGPKQKPQSCIDFPFRHVETPAGSFVGLSFACTAVLEDTGRPVEEWRGALQENRRESVHARRVDERPALTRLERIDFQACLELESALDELLAIERVPLRQRLGAQALFLDVVAQAFRSVRAEGSEAAAEAAQAGDARVVAALAARYRAERWGRLLALAAKQPGAPRNQRAFLGLVTTFRDPAWARSGRLAAMARLVQRYLGAAFRRGRLRLPPLDHAITFDQLSSLAPDESPGGAWDRLMTRYLRHALFRKDLLGGESIVAAHKFQLMHVALVRWYAAALAAEAGEAAPSEPTLREALRTVEKYFVHHTAFSRFLETQPLLGTLVDAVMGNARYAASMTGPAVEPD